MPEEMLEKIIGLLHITDRVRGMRVSRAWNRITRSSLAKQSSLALVSERVDSSRYFSCCFGCHRTFISHLNVLRVSTVARMQVQGVRIADYCPNVTVLRIEDHCMGSGTAVLTYYMHQVRSLSIPGLRIAGRTFPRLEHVETILHDYSDPVMQSGESMRQALPRLQCISLSHLKFFLYESLLPHGIKHVSLLGANSLAQISESGAAGTLTRLDYEEGFLRASQTDVSFHFPRLQAFFYEDTMNVIKFDALVQHLLPSRELHTLRFYIAIAPVTPAAQVDAPVQHNDGISPADVWKKLFRGTPNLGELQLHSLAYQTRSLEFNDEVVGCMTHCCPDLHTLILFDKDDSLTDASLDHLSRLTKLQVLDIESRNALFSRSAILRFLTTAAARSKLRQFRIRGGKRRAKRYAEHSLVRSFLAGNEWRVASRSAMHDHSTDDPDIVSAVIWGLHGSGTEPDDPLQQQLDLLARESCLTDYIITGTID